jgi:hypothetical protein
MRMPTILNLTLLCAMGHIFATAHIFVVGRIFIDRLVKREAVWFDLNEQYKDTIPIITDEKVIYFHT